MVIIDVAIATTFAVITSSATTNAAKVKAVKNKNEVHFTSLLLAKKSYWRKKNASRALMTLLLSFLE